MARAPVITFDGRAFRASPWRGPEPAAGWGSVFAVRAGEDSASPPMMGAYEADGEALIFTPRFAPSQSVIARAVFESEDGAVAKASFGQGVVALEPTTRIAAIYPSTNIWPANQLKFYIEFSAPMSIGEAWDRVRLLENGEKIEAAFVEIEQELWDGEGRRLTVLFDPARIKRGLIDHEQHGLPLNAGRPVVLEIDADWKDARGAPLIAGARKEIDVVAELRKPVDPSAWTITAPRGVSPLIVDVPRPLEYATALRAISVQQSGARVSGNAHLERDETRWVFTPDASWRGGEYEIVVESFIEDMAGNKLGRLFDVDTADSAQQKPAPERGVRTFRVEPA